MIDWMIWTITYQTPVRHICSDYSHIELRVRFISFCIFSIFTKCTGASAQKVPESDKGPPQLIKSVRGAQKGLCRAQSFSHLKNK